MYKKYLQIFRQNTEKSLLTLTKLASIVDFGDFNHLLDLNSKNFAFGFCLYYVVSFLSKATDESERISEALLSMNEI